MSIVITGAPGHPGRLVVDQLLAAGTVPARRADYLRDSGPESVIVRNGRYLASRHDYASAAVSVLTQDGHLGATYELGGTPFTQTQFAATIGEVLDTHIAYQDTAVGDYTSALTAAGLPPEMADADADADAGLAGGEWFTASDDLVRLIGRPATTAREAVQNAVSIEQSR